MSVRVGTSGWAYPEWQPHVYPAGLPRDRFLAHHATLFGMCEVNATFYRVPSEAAVRAWADATPAGYHIVAKAPRALTHSARFAQDGPDPGLVARLGAALAPLAGRTRALLVRLPDTMPRDDARLDALLAALLPAHLPVMDMRHPSWDAAEVRERVAAAGGTVCLNETAGAVPGALPPGPVGYVRLRADGYDDAAREAWRELLRAEGARRDVHAVGRHRGLPPDDPHRGVGFALWLAERLAG